MVESPQTGIEREVAELYAEYSAELYRFAAMILRPHDGAGDAVQETFLRYFAERKCGGTMENPRAWLYRVLHNYLMDRLGKAAARHEVQAAEAAEPVDRAQGPEELIVRSQAAREIAAGLTGRELECLKLRVQGLSYEEVAGALGIRSGTVGALLNRVHKKLLAASGGTPWRKMRIAEALGALLHEGGTYSS